MQHALGTVHGVDLAIGELASQANRNVRGSASQIQHPTGDALACKTLAKQVYEHSIGLGKICFGVGARLGRFVHQLGFGDAQHG
jgi:hypothetical protein